MDQPPRQSSITSFLSGPTSFPASSSIKGSLGSIPQMVTHDTQHGHPIRHPGLLTSHVGPLAQPSGLRYTTILEPDAAAAIDLRATATSLNINRDLNHLSSENRPHTGLGRLPANVSDQTHSMMLPSKTFGYLPKSTYSDFDSSDNAAKRKVGRPRVYPLPEPKPKRRQRKADLKRVPPKFIPFLCEWKDCKAELHNLETLRKHVYSVHAKFLPSGDILCLWGKCGTHREIRDKETGTSMIAREYYKFEDLEKFKTHAEKVHLIPFAWHMGDGPRSSALDGSESDRSSYLSDGSGRQITPSVVSQEVETGSARVNNARRLAQQKLQIDPSLESLVRFATPAIQAGFYMPDPGIRQRVAPTPRPPPAGSLDSSLIFR